MKARVQKKDSFVVAGFRNLVDPGEGMVTAWDDVAATLTAAEADLSLARRVGIIAGMTPEHKFDYVAGIFVETKEDAEALGLNAAVVPAGRFAVVEVTGPVPDSSLAGIDYLTRTFMPQNRLRPAGPVFEVYGQGDATADNYTMEVWMPVVPIS